jgi:hypothetical protein
MLNAECACPVIPVEKLCLKFGEMRICLRDQDVCFCGVWLFLQGKLHLLVVTSAIDEILAVDAKC